MGFSRLLKAAVGLALLVAMVGAFVRLTDAGLGCPDWPGCYGHLASLPDTPQEIAAAQAQDPRGTYDAGKAFREMLHRYLAGALGLVVLALTLLCLSGRGDARLARGMLGLLALVAFQALLGMWTVTLQLKPLIVTAHLLGGFATLAWLWWLLLRHWNRPDPPPGPPPTLQRWCAAALALLILQIALGGWTSTNYAALACPDFPTCRGQWWPPDMNFRDAFVLWRGLGVNYEFGILDSPARTAIHVAHRIGAAFAALAMLALALAGIRTRVAAWRRRGLLLLALLAGQFGLGIGNVVWQLPLAIATAHHAGAAVLLLAVLTQFYRLRERKRMP